MDRARRIPWVTLLLVCFAGACSARPGWVAALEYVRSAVLGGDAWRPVTSQLVHWTPRMAFADLTVLLVAGSILEVESRRRLLATLAAAAVAVSLVLPMSAGLERYRGSSGLAVACIAALATCWIFSGPARLRLVGLAVLALFAMKLGWESATGSAIFAGPLPAGVRVVPAVHATAAVVGIAVGLARPARRH